MPTKTVPFVVIIVGVGSDHGAIAVQGFQITGSVGLVVVEGLAVKGGLSLTRVHALLGGDR